MKKNILTIFILLLATNMYAGWFSFAGDVASISTALSSKGASQTVTNSDMKKVNQYLWEFVKNDEVPDGYELLAEVLEKSNNINQIDTAAQAYYIGGNKEKALELYETRILPTARAVDPNLIKYYKIISGLSSSESIDYDLIYAKNNSHEYTKEEPSEETINNIIELILLGILIVLFINLLVSLGLFSRKADKPQ